MNVVFVAPYLGENMLRCLEALASLDVHVGLVSHQKADVLPVKLRQQMAGHYRIDNTLDSSQLTGAVAAFVKEWGGVDRLIGYLEQLQVPLAVARERLGIQGMWSQTARNFRDKNRMKEVLRAAGVSVARQRLVKEPSDALDFVHRVGYPVVLKPVDGMGSKATMRATDDAELYQALNRLMPRPDAPIQCEEFVTGEEHTCETVMIDGRVVWRTSTYYLPGPLKVLENPWMQYCVLLPREEEPHVTKFAPVNEAALRALGMTTGLSHMEWFLRPDGTPVVNEVGARPPGVNIMRMNDIITGGDMWRCWLEVQIFGRWTMPKRTAAAGCVFLRGQGRGRRVAGVSGAEKVIRLLGDQFVDARWPQVGAPRSTGYEGEGWVIVKGDDTKSAVDALKIVVNNVQVVLDS